MLNRSIITYTGQSSGQLKDCDQRYQTRIVFGNRQTGLTQIHSIQHSFVSVGYGSRRNSTSPGLVITN